MKSAENQPKVVVLVSSIFYTRGVILKFEKDLKVIFEERKNNNRSTTTFVQKHSNMHHSNTLVDVHFCCRLKIVD